MDVYRTDVVLLLQSRILLASAAQKMIPPPDICGAPFRRLTCGPTKLTGTKGFVNLVNLNDSSCSDCTMSIQRPSCFFNLWSSCSSRPKQRRSCRLLLPPVAGCAAAEASPPPYYSHRWPGHPTTHPHPLLFYGDGSLTPQPNPRTPLHVGIHCRVFPGSASSPS